MVTSIKCTVFYFMSTYSLEKKTAFLFIIGSAHLLTEIGIGIPIANDVVIKCNITRPYHLALTVP